MPTWRENTRVGPRNRILAHVDDPGAGVAVGQGAQPLPYLGRALPRARGDRGVGQLQVGELPRKLGLDPALLEGELDHNAAALRRSSSSVRLPSLVSTTSPPARAKIVVGQPPIP